MNLQNKRYRLESKMAHVSVVDVLSGKFAIGDAIVTKGWVRTRRDSKAGLSFINVHDGSCFDAVQVIAMNNLPNYADIQKLTTGCSVAISGVIKASEGKGQALEIEATNVEVLGWVENPDTYPMAAKRHSVEFLREQAHLRARTNIIGAVTRVRNCVSQALHRFFHEQGFYWISTPILTGSDTEGAGEMFRVSTLDALNLPLDDKGAVDYSQDFFGKETYLTVSGQLNVETYACAMSKVYTFGPTFRAENSHTSRHLAEFWMVEPEVAFADLSDIAQLAEDMLKYVFKAVLEERADDMAFFAQRVEKEAISRLEKVIQQEFVRMDYTDAIDILKASGKKFEYPVEWGVDLASEHERYLAEEHVGAPIIMQNYPKDIKAFYMRINDDGKTVAAMDVLAPGIGEIIGGSQREERLDVFDRRLAEMELDQEDYSWYRDLRRYGTVPHSGFGLGFERIVAYITGVQNIRDIAPFPRTQGSAPY
jgi:asparaginyl-tRNA synthetase